MKAGMVNWAKGDVESTNAALAVYGNAIQSVRPLNKSKAAVADFYKNFDSNMSVREGMTWDDYNYFRPNEAVPTKTKDIIRSCLHNYYSVGFVRNTLDLMSEFATEGVRWTHANKQVEKLANAWFWAIGGNERSERFVNILYKAGNVAAKVATAKIPTKKIEEYQKTIGEADLEFPEDQKVEKRVVPWQITYLNPVYIDVVNPELSMFSGQKYYSIKISNTLQTAIKFPKTEQDRKMIAAIPADVRKAIQDGDQTIILDSNKVKVYHYKKDDWQSWAYPMTYSILEDLITLKKLKLADMAALDGAISHIRLWKLGNLEHQMLPTDAAVEKLSGILLNHVGGGTMDLIWGPDIELEETSSDLSTFLGIDKYQPTLISIYAGLGIPQSMTGGQGDGGAGNNFMSVKTMVERLKYGRDILVSFWDDIMKAFSKAMGWKTPPTMVFDHMSLGDEVNERALWIRLYEEGVISMQTLQERFEIIPEVEMPRIKREYKDIQSGKLPPKAGPYYDAEPDASLRKIALQNGMVVPSEVGLELDPKKAGEQSMLDLQVKQQEIDKKQAGVSGQGRPLNSGDSKKRKQKRVTPTAKSSTREFAATALWANEAQERLAEIVNPLFLKWVNKKNLRSLTTAETHSLDNFKKSVLYNLPAQSEVTPDILNKPISVYNTCELLENKLIADFRLKRGVEPTVDETKQIRSLVYTTIRGEF